jgi:carbon monoxide dehydrogenase subunit G
VAIHFDGEFTTPRNPDEVFEFLSDPNKFGPLFPDFESMSLDDPTHFTMKLNVAVGNIHGTAELKMELAEALRPRRALYKGTGTAAGSQIAIGAGFDLSSAAEGTRVAWQGEASVFGKLAKLTSGMLEPVVKGNIQKLIDGLRWALCRPPSGAIAKTTVSEAERVVSAEEIFVVEQPAASKELPPASAEGDTSTSRSKLETRN